MSISEYINASESQIPGQRGMLEKAEGDVGYQTDTAFSRAFRREYGAPPAAWRRTHATHEQAGRVRAA